MSFRSRKVSGAPLVATGTSNPISRGCEQWFGRRSDSRCHDHLRRRRKSCVSDPRCREQDGYKCQCSSRECTATRPRLDGLRELGTQRLDLGMGGVELLELVERGPGVGESARAYRGSRRLQPPFDPALACALLEPRPALHGHERAFAALQLCGARRRTWHRPRLCKMSSGTLPLLLLDFRPGVPERHGSVENKCSRSGIGIDREVAQPFELKPRPNGRRTQARLNLTRGEHFERGAD